MPISALFSALCLALAAFARSTKEGQYYLMPLLLVTMPLVILPMSPGVELNLGNSLIPVTGVVLPNQNRVKALFELPDHRRGPCNARVSCRTAGAARAPHGT